MPKSIQDLREARAAKTAEFRALAHKEKLTSAEQATYDVLHAEVLDLKDQEARIEASNALTIADNLKDNVRDRALMFAKDKPKLSEGSKAFALFLAKTELRMTPDELTLFRNTMSTTTEAEGGYTVDPEVAQALLVRLLKFGGMRQVASTIATATGAALNFPTADPTQEQGEIVPENGATSALDTSFGTLGLPAYMYSSKSIAVPLQLLQDSVIDIEGYVLGLIAMRIGRIQNAHFTTGSGVSQPRGLLTGASVGVIGANGSTVTMKADDIFNLYHSVDPAYRELGNLRFMMNDASLLAIRKVKDNNARFMFNPGFESGPPGTVPDTLIGVPVVTNQQMPVMAANATSVAFGDFGFYKIRDVMGLIVRRFDDSAFGLKGQVGFCGWQRSGGNFIDVGGAVKLFQNSAI